MTSPALYGVAGDPIAHSLSPLIHRGWMRKHGLAADYTAFQIPAGAFATSLEALERRGLEGLNVTLPHKRDALAAANQASLAAARIGAANVLKRTPEGWLADNTDAPGFVDDLGAHARDLAGMRFVLIGAGGAARAAAYALLGRGAPLCIVNRSLDNAEAMLRDLKADRRPGDVRPLEDFDAAIADADIVINATSLGHGGGGFDWPVGRGRLLYDLSYGRAADQVLSDAAAKGWRTADGLGMLVAQAALSFEIWFGIAPNRETALARCRQALEAAS